MAEDDLTGGCQCGAVRYRVPAQPLRTSVCYCRMCQRASGAPFMAFMRHVAADVAWSGQPAIFKSSSFVERGFCGACGTPLSYRWVEGPNVSLTVNSLDDPEAVRPDLRYSPETEVSWCRTLQGLPAKSVDVTGEARFVNHQRTVSPARD
jgi:hypothetical protein